jgi:hypothetical protein
MDGLAGITPGGWTEGQGIVPRPGSPEELSRFRELQRRLAPLFRRAFPDPRAPQTVVVVPSMTLDPAELAKLTGAAHYEERLLCILMLLRRPRTRVVYVTSEPIPASIVEYYLHLLPGVPCHHARERLTLISCHDGSALPLTAKILARPRLCARIRAAIADPRAAHLTCFNPDTAGAHPRRAARHPLLRVRPRACPPGHQEREPRGVPPRRRRAPGRLRAPAGLRRRGGRALRAEGARRTAAPRRGEAQRGLLRRGERPLLLRRRAGGGAGGGG